MELSNSKIKEFFQKQWKMIAIVYYGRSGSFFLQSILDGHPEIIALPPHINNLYQITYEKDRKIFREKFALKSVAKIFGGIIKACLWNFSKEHDVFSGPCRLYGENRDILFHYDYDHFMHIFNQIMYCVSENGITITRKQVYISLFLAYNIMIGKDLNDLIKAKYLLTQLHTPLQDELREVKKDFDNFTYLVSVREPVSGLISHIEACNEMLKVNYFNEGAYNWCVPLIFKELLYGATVYDFIGKYNCVAVKNEYLHIYQDDYVKCLLTYLNLQWHDMCSKSTIDSEIFWWKYGKEYKTGFNPKYKWKICDKKDASCRDKRFFSYLLQDRYLFWEYKRCPVDIMDIKAFLSEGFDFSNYLNLSPYIREQFKEICQTYYYDSFHKHKEYIPTLDFTAKDETSKFNIECTFV